MQPRYSFSSAHRSELQQTRSRVETPQGTNRTRPQIIGITDAPSCPVSSLARPVANPTPLDATLCVTPISFKSCSNCEVQQLRPTTKRPVCVCVCDAQSLNKLKAFAVIHYVYSSVLTAAMF